MDRRSTIRTRLSLVGATVAAAVAVCGCAPSPAPTASSSPRPAASAPSAAPSAASASSPSPSSSAVAVPSPSSPAAPSGAAAGNPAPYVEGAPYAPVIDPANFVAVIDNPYSPWIPGMRWVYTGRDEHGKPERNTVVVTSRTKVILGITATVVHDQVFSGGELAEDTFDWYAQDTAGNVWYLGEDTKELDHGKVTSTEGSWEAGVDGAQPGIIMLADPTVSETYRQEYLAGEAEDVAMVLRLGGSVTVKAGTYDDIVTTREWTPLEPDIVEHKTYARGVGVVLERVLKGSKERSELARVSGP